MNALLVVGLAVLAIGTSSVEGSKRFYEVDGPGNVISVIPGVSKGKVVWNMPFGELTINFHQQQKTETCISSMEDLEGIKQILAKEGSGTWTTYEAPGIDTPTCITKNSGESMTVKVQSHATPGPIERDSFSFEITDV